MSRLSHMLIFYSIFALILCSAHYYLFARLSSYFMLTGNTRRAVMIGTIFLCALTVSALPLSRQLPREIATPFAWLTFSWMGILMFMFLVFIATDIAALVTAAAHPETSNARRDFMQRIFGFTALGATAVLSGAALWGGLKPVHIKPVTVTLSRLPKALSGFRIAQISDIHIGPTLDGAWLQNVVDQTNSLNADMIAITGDLMDGSAADLAKHVEPLRQLKAPQGVFFVTGNHEYYSGVDEWVPYIESLGIRVLMNEHVTLALPGGAIDIAGTEDHSAHQFPGHGEDFSKALDGRNTNNPVILMAHQPASVYKAAEYGVDLQLAGHTHGGQIWPWNFLVKLNQPYVMGLHQHPNSNTQIYVSCGTGYWGPPMRLGTSAEITHIILKSA